MNYLVTGTRTFGPSTDNSDLDIMVLETDFKTIIKYLEDHNIEIHQNEYQKTYPNSGLYFDLFNITINIVTAQNQDELNTWKNATEKMRKISPINNRQERINIFKQFLNDF